jgi:hypothetical protein
MRLFKNQAKFITARPCPFCGGIPKVSRCGDHRDFWYVRCTECFETPIDWGDAKVSPDQAVKIYNKRADTAERIIRTYKRVKERENEV